MPRIRLILCTLLLTGSAVRGEGLSGFEATGFNDEQQRTLSPENGVRAVINAASDFDGKRATLLVLYALPNGNTIEQTLGTKVVPGVDWHFDIQHIAAQARKLRQLDRERNIVVAAVEADTKSWPKWRSDRPTNGVLIRGVVAAIAREIPGQPPRFALAAHSGGGSFIFGYINGGEAIAENIERLVFLDANYAYDDEHDHHGDKLLAWLRGDPKRQLSVIAYDDRFVMLSGKPVLKTPLGGTYGASHRMIDRFGKEMTFAHSTRGPFDEIAGMSGQIRFLIHGNPELRILHTVLVERNGLIEGMTQGTRFENKWGGQFWGDRAYSDLIAPASRSPTTLARTATTRLAGIPDRSSSMGGGKAFAESIADLPAKACEAAIVQEVLRGNIPDFLRRFHTVRLNRCTFDVMPDYLAVGSDDDYVRMPMTPASATAIADAFGCSLPTRTMVNEVYQQADVKVEPRPLTERREAVRTFIEHNRIIQEQLAGKKLGLLVAGDKKDVVLTNRLKERPNKVAIYGWHKLDGKPIQELYVGHADSYVDYSHGIRLVKRQVTVDGKPRDIGDVLKDAELSKLLSDEGPITP
jgi:hypothetical protein